MSRLSSMNPEAIRTIFSPDADADLLMLLTIYDPADPTSVVMRICDGYTKRIVDIADQEVVYGVTGGANTQHPEGFDFTFIPMQITLPQEDEAQAPKCSITLNDVTRYATPLIRSLTGPPKVLIQLVLSSTPLKQEVAFDGLYINSFTYNADSVVAELSMIDYEREPFPMHTFSPKYFPGLF